MIARTQLDGQTANLDSHATGAAPPPGLAAFDEHAQKGWAWFTKFLFWNVVTVVGALVVVALLTVWS
jgi:hypothetical protein